MRQKLKTIALFNKPRSPQAWGVLNEAAAWARHHGLEPIQPRDAQSWAEVGWDVEFLNSVRERADLAMPIGGDGTLLGVARALFGWGRPLLGVNLGTLGFLTDVAASRLEQAFGQLARGDYELESRILLTARLNGFPDEGLAFNDVVLSKGDIGRLIEFDVFVNGDPVFRLRADGLIITTPTGSTAYALSAMGPILHPSLPAIALVPLAPHSLTARPITLPSSAHIEVVVRGQVPARLYCDSQAFGEVLGDGARITVAKGSSDVSMMHLPGYSAFHTLREKLGWAEARKG